MPLKYALTTWLNDTRVKEIVLVDWGSTVPLHTYCRESLFKLKNYDPRIRFVRVVGNPRWEAAAAFNLAFSEASHDTVIKIDGDVLFTKLSVDGFIPEEGEFISGNWKDADNYNEWHTNGFLAVSRRGFDAVNGYDERIQSYGWEDCELYERLELAGYRRSYVSRDRIFHLPHGDAERISYSKCPDMSTQELILKNKYETSVRDRWGTHYERHAYTTVSDQGDLKVVRQRGSVIKPGQILKTKPSSGR